MKDPRRINVLLTRLSATDSLSSEVLSKNLHEVPDAA